MILVACMLAWCARHLGVVNMSYFISIPGPESQTCMPAAAAATLIGLWLCYSVLLSVVV